MPHSRVEFYAPWQFGQLHRARRMGLSIFGQLKDRLRGGGPDVGYAAHMRAFKARASRVSNQLSHAAFLGLAAIVLLPDNRAPPAGTVLHPGRPISSENAEPSSLPSRATKAPPSIPYDTLSRAAVAASIMPLHTAPPLPAASVTPPAAKSEPAAVASGTDAVEASGVTALDTADAAPVSETARVPPIPPVLKLATAQPVMPAPVVVKTSTARPPDLSKKLKKLRAVKVRERPLPRNARLRPVGPLDIVAATAPHDDHAEIMAVDVALTSLPPRTLIKAKNYGKPLRISRRDARVAVEAARAKDTVAGKAKETPAAASATQDTPAQNAKPVAPDQQQATAWTEEEIASARGECARLLTSLTIEAAEEAPFREGICGAPAAIRVSSIGAPKVKMEPGALLTCPMAAALHTWLNEKVQPAAKDMFGSPVTRLISASSYSCRNRYGLAKAPLSEHALVNALDLSGFVLADGRTVRVLNDWGPVARDAKPPMEQVAQAKTPVVIRAGISLLGAGGRAPPPAIDGKSSKDTSSKGTLSKDKTDVAAAPVTEKPLPAAPVETKQSTFLHRVHDEACGIFGTVLGPESNDAHRNHFHLDMKARKHKGFCQ